MKTWGRVPSPLRAVRKPTLYGAVNKRNLSTGETGEFASENLGFGLKPGVELAPPPRLSSNRRERAAWKNLRYVADTGEGGAQRCCQRNNRSELGRKGSGSPRWIRTVIDITVEIELSRTSRWLHLVALTGRFFGLLN
jgi:hypothetical protein